LKLSPHHAPAAASTTSTPIRGSVLPAVATPSVMIAVSAGTTGSSASRAGSTNAIK